MANKVLLKKSSTAAKVPTTSDLDYGELALNYADGKLYYKNSSNVVQSFGSTSYTRVTSNTTAVAGKKYICDTTSAAFTLTLPASPVSGDTVVIGDGGSFSTNNLTVGRNSSTIDGISDDLALNIDGIEVTLVYDGTTWQVYTQIGANGGSEVTIAGTQTLTNKTLTSPTITAPTITGATSISYTPGSATGQALSITAKDTQGGVGYADFLKVTNTTSGATNPNKTFRLNSTGFLEIINSAYSATLLSLSDTGNLSIGGDYRVNGKKAVNGPAFRAHISTGQAITSGSQQKVIFGGETFDTDSCFASSTFTPNVEGYYQLNATVRIDGTSSTGECMIILYKNGSEYARGNNEQGTEQGNNFYSMQVSDIAYANGTTDNFEIRIQQTSGSNRNTTAGAAISYFSGCMIRGA